MLQALWIVWNNRRARLLLTLFLGVTILSTALQVRSSDPLSVIVGYVLGTVAGISVSPLLWAALLESESPDQVGASGQTSFVEAGDVADDDEW